MTLNGGTMAPRQGGNIPAAAAQVFSTKLIVILRVYAIFTITAVRYGRVFEGHAREP